MPGPPTSSSPSGRAPRRSRTAPSRMSTSFSVPAAIRGEAALSSFRRTPAGAPRTSAAANRALIAVPGAYAALDAHQALSAGLHVFLFSDGVSLDDEVALKRRARDLRRLVMGPECGTAIINGVGLGFGQRG